MALTTVLLAQSADPSYLSTCPVPPTILLEKNTAHGGKFWKAIALPHGLSIRFGRLNTAGQERNVDQPRCAMGNPVQELMIRALTKIREGYALRPL